MASRIKSSPVEASTHYRTFVNLLPWLLVASLSLGLLVSHRQTITAYASVYAGKGANDRERSLEGATGDLGYHFVQHFPGLYGAAALQALIKWSDSMFARTMSTYRDRAIGLCAVDESGLTSSECNAAAEAHRAPEPKTKAEFYDLFDPFVSCPDPEALDRVGRNGEGGKMVCTDLLDHPDCVVFSLGSSGQFDFELDILQRTECDVYTFDCTYNGRSIPGFEDRHKYLKKCIGTAARAEHDPEFITLANAVQDLGLKLVTLLKIDIEGSEFDELAGWQVEHAATLPEMIAIEVHNSEVIYSGTSAYGQTNSDAAKDVLIWPMMHLQQSDMALFFGGVARLGYALASREDNPFGNCCSEFLLLKVADWRADTVERR